MLSILIPVYNLDVTRLVNSLYNQAKMLDIDFEIIAMEDGSKFFTGENSIIKNFDSNPKSLTDDNIKNLDGSQNRITHIILPENIGRSAIRNRLADTAKYPFLLFLDCDVEIDKDDFLKTYLPYCKENVAVIGGIKYDENYNNPNESLRLMYGRRRESNNTQFFVTPNFLIDKNLFQKIRFDETIVGYGCEDLIFGVKLKDFTVIDNRVIHKGLPTNEKFLDNTKNAIENLFTLYQSGEYPTLPHNSRVLSTFVKIKKLHLVPLVRLSFHLFKTAIITNLKSPHPSLFLFDIYKLGIICDSAKRL
ncbi:MAG: glycosyltransferase [Bacteroidales bacterium]|jgi:glycosyltransferase involved in cell wall biosynthesis|nr:glycosyltransferase [Bacteroidales bacterium]